jgi:hypothetical protein
MGSRVIEEYWCDTCDKCFSDEHVYYHSHSKYAGGSGLWHLSRRVELAESEEEKIDAICQHFGFSNGTATCNVRHAFYDEEVIKCIIKGMRYNMIHNENWEQEGDVTMLSNDKVADFIEKSIPKLKKAYNDFIKRASNEKRKELEKEIYYLESRMV